MNRSLTRTNKTILLVEDNPDDRELAMLAFEAIDIRQQVRVAEDGVEALEFLFGTGQSVGGVPLPMPAVILLDLKLPKVNGLEVLQQIRAHERTRLLPVVILTTSSEERDLVASYGLGCNSYICKSVDFEQFQEAIRQLGLYWLRLNHIPPLPFP